MMLSNTRRYALAFGLVSLLSLSACGGGGGGDNTSSWADTSGSTAVTTLQITDTLIGTGAVAGTSSTVSVNYTGWLYDVRVAGTQKGTQFDTSVGKSPLGFVVGKGQVISGFDQGVAGMKVGGKRTVVIPASLGYGTSGNGAIPANAALIFDIELLSAQ